MFHASPAGVPPQLSTLVHRSIEESEAGRGGLEFAEGGEGERYRTVAIIRSERSGREESTHAYIRLANLPFAVV